MVRIEKKILEELRLEESSKDIIISNCLILTLDMNFLQLASPVIIENCCIHSFMINTCWFSKGLIFRNNIVLNDIHYEMGGHNKHKIEFKHNIFHVFFDFFDCHFEEEVEVANNIFVKGTNLLGNKNTGYVNLFKTGISVKDNIGILNMNI